MQASHSSSNEIRDLEKLIKGAKVAMFTTRTADCRLVSRPLTTRDMAFDGDLWFLSTLDSRKISELGAEPMVNLAYVNHGDGSYVSINGRAEISQDRAKIHELWSETFDSLYFPIGKDDPNLILIRVVVETAEAWTSSTTAVGRVFDFIKAKITGDVSALGEQKHYNLDHS